MPRSSLARFVRHALPPAAIAMCAAFVAVPLATAADAPAKVAFPVGWWVGSGTFDGSLAKGETRITQERGKLRFSLVVDREEEVDGVMTVLIPEKVTVRNGSGSAVIAGTLTLSGDADRVEMDGELLATGTGNAMGFTFDIDVPVPPYTHFEPELVSCTHVMGDLAKPAAGHNAALGFSSSLRQPFIATRVKERPNKEDVARIADQLSSSYTKAFTAMGAAAKGGDAAQLEAAIDDVEGMLASAGGFGECGGSGALRGVRIDCELMSGFATALAKRLAAEPSTRELLDLTFLAARLGVFEGSAWCPAVDDAKEALDDALIEAVKVAKKDGDEETLRDVGVASAMYGLEEIYEDVDKELHDEAL